MIKHDALNRFTEVDLANGEILEVTAGTITVLDLAGDIYVLDATDSCKCWCACWE
jgi:hypothetical protein